MWACIENIECKFCWSILTHPRLDKNGKENPMIHWSQCFPGRQPLFLAAWSWRPQESSAATIRSSINSCADVGRVVENPQRGWRVSPWWRVDLGVEFFAPQKRRIWATIWVSPSGSCMTHEEFSYWIHECVLFARTHRASGCPCKSGSATSLLCTFVEGLLTMAGIGWWFLYTFWVVRTCEHPHRTNRYKGFPSPWPLLTGALTAQGSNSASRRTWEGRWVPILMKPFVKSIFKPGLSDGIPFVVSIRGE